MMRETKKQSASSALSPLFRSFREIPATESMYVRDFREHIKATASPETFPGLHPGPLNKSETFWKIVDFEVEGHKRPQGDRVPCPMCHHNNKFLKGWLVYLPKLQAVAAIGCECADKEVLAAANREFKARRDRDHEEDYLLANLPLVSGKLLDIASIFPTAEEALRIYRLFRSKGEPFQRQLRDVSKRGGMLTLNEEIVGDVAAIGPRGFRGTNGTTTREISFGLLNGITAVKANYDPVAELNRIAGMLKDYRVADTEEASLDFIVALENAARAHAYVALSEAARAYENFSKRLTDFVKFFEPENIARVHNWANHLSHPRPFETSFKTENRIRYLVMQNKAHSFKVTLRAVLWAAVPKWQTG